MSLAIDVDRVIRVLLADGWHDVVEQSFSLDAYEYLWSGRDGVTVDQLDAEDDAMLLHGGGQGGVCATGFGFRDEKGRWLCGPLTSVLAVEVERP